MSRITAADIIDLVIAYLLDIDDLPSWSKETWRRRLHELEVDLDQRLSTED